MNKGTKTTYYMLSVIPAGMICLVWAFLNLPFNTLNVHFLIIFAFTIAIGSRMSIQIPKFKSHIAVSDTFIFLILLLYGGETAIVVAAIEAFFSSMRFCKKNVTVFFNTAVMAIATTVMYATLILLGLIVNGRLVGNGEDYKSFFLIISVMALVQFISNTILASMYGALKSDKPFWETWKANYAWTFITYFVGAIGAGILLQAVKAVGFGIVIVIIPIIFFVYLSYRMYAKNLEISNDQAEQAKEHARVLEEQSNALIESEERFRSAFNYAPIGIALVSPNGRWQKVNHALCQILGYTEEEFLDSEFQKMLFEEDLGNTLIKINELLTGKVPSCQLEQRYVHKSGKTVWASWSVSTATDAKAENPSLIFQIQDITDRKIAEEQLQYKATHDALTDLPNRAFFMSKLKEALEKAKQYKNYRVSVLFIDLDRFKIINDSLGHLVGDELLIQIAVRLRECLRPNDMVARLGGDEFTILVEGNYDTKEVIRIAERIQAKFSIPFDLKGNEIYSSASIGILNNSDNHLTAEDMMRDADTAMYQAKRGGKSRHEVFDENMHEVAKETLQLENDLRRAVEKEEFSIFYQPIYSIETKEIQGYEALARWTHPIHGAVPPDKFIPLAEEIGLINVLGMQILRQACQQGYDLKKNFHKNSPFMMSVNISSKQFGHPNLVENILQVLKETRLPAENLKLEITESVFIEHKEKSISMLNELREYGIEINIDDFGTGYSNLSYLMQLPISTLKIDRSFIAPMSSDGRNTEIVETILTLAERFGIKVIAEGVENEIQIDQLKKLHCEGAQGFYFAKPMEFEKLIDFLDNEQNHLDNLPEIINDLPVASTIC